MTGFKLAGVIVIVLGALALAYGGFTYTKDTHKADIGPVHLSIADKEHVNVPVWAGVTAIVVGGLMLFAGSRR